MRAYTMIRFLLSSMLTIDVSLTSACTAFDSMGSKVTNFNEAVGDYANSAILLNVIRASESEPLAFISITGITGADSMSAAAGLPLNFGPHVHTSPRGYALGPNSVTFGTNNTYNISILDDPTSYAALLAPITPATIGFFIREKNSRALLFFLLTAEIDEVQYTIDARTKVSKITNVDARYYNNPDDPIEFNQFVQLMAGLIFRGLTAQIDVTSVPAGRALPPSKVCMDPLSERLKLDPEFIENESKEVISQKESTLRSFKDLRVSGEYSELIIGKINPYNDRLTNNNSVLTNDPKTSSRSEASMPSPDAKAEEDIVKGLLQAQEALTLTKSEARVAKPDSSKGTAKVIKKKNLATTDSDPSLNSCLDADWIESQSSNASNSNTGSSSAGGGGVSAMIAGPAGSVLAVLGSKLIKVDEAGNVTTLYPALNAQKRSSVSQGVIQPTPANGFIFMDYKSGKYYSLIFRSPYAAYQYIGKMSKDQRKVNLVVGADGNPVNPDKINQIPENQLPVKKISIIKEDDAEAQIIKIISKGDLQANSVFGINGKCFAQMTYHDKQYCVPDNSDNSKEIFTILHQMFELNAAPSNTPATITVNAVPG